MLQWLKSKYQALFKKKPLPVAVPPPLDNSELNALLKKAGEGPTPMAMADAKDYWPEEIWSNPKFGTVTKAKPKVASQYDGQDENLIKMVEIALKNGRKCPTCGADDKFTGDLQYEEYKTAKEK